MSVPYSEKMYCYLKLKLKLNIFLKLYNLVSWQMLMIFY